MSPAALQAAAGGADATTGETVVTPVTATASGETGAGSRQSKGRRGGDERSAWEVYCTGPLLEAVQIAHLFPDSKTFVDMPMKQDPAAVLEAFEALAESDRRDEEKLTVFVAEHFAEAGSDLVPLAPPDFSPQPPFLGRIRDERRRKWASAIHGLWAQLVRRVVDEVALHPGRHSLLPRRHPVVVPGGRFRESYYWDSFWTIRGLLVSGMVDTARGVALNLLDDVDRYGFVPNGGRLYYTKRSQPPLLSEMVSDVYSASPDLAFLARALPSLEAEHAFWMDFERGRAVCAPAPPPPEKTCAAMSQGHPPEGAAVLLNRYWGAMAAPTGSEDAAGAPGVGGPLLSRSPRPESYREDAALARGECGYAGSRVEADDSGPAEETARKLAGVCHELAAAAESGWDFSSRWTGERKTTCAAAAPAPIATTAGEEETSSEPEPCADKRNFCLSDTATTSVVPVDLNAFLHRMELNIARLNLALATPRRPCAWSMSPESRRSDAEAGQPGSEVEKERSESFAASNGTSVQAQTDPLPAESSAVPVLPDVQEGGAANAVAPLLDAPPLLTLDEMQRRYLTRQRGVSSSSWSSSSTIAMEATVQTVEAEKAVSATEPASPGAESAPGGASAWQVLFPKKAVMFAGAARARAKAMEQTMWDGQSGLWRDLLLPTGEQSSSITPACFVPLWAGLPWPSLDDDEEIDGQTPGGIASFSSSQGAARLERCVESLRKSGLVQPGGVCTSLEDTGQQWDGRNAWPPLQWLLIQGLRRTADVVANYAMVDQELAAAAAAVDEGAATAAPEKGEGSFVTRGEGDALTSGRTNTEVGKTAGDGQGAFSSESRLEHAVPGVAAARGLATELEESFLNGALACWESSGAMMEKYDAKEVGEGGGGGEYNVQEKLYGFDCNICYYTTLKPTMRAFETVTTSKRNAKLQVGFGWTNGVALDLMAPLPWSS